MTADQFRRLALALPGASESAHMNHPDFRVVGKIFASLGYPDEGHGMVKLTSAEQKAFIGRASEVFAPCAGAWGRQGSTSVQLAKAKVAIVRAALAQAHAGVLAKARKK